MISVTKVITNIPAWGVLTYWIYVEGRDQKVILPLNEIRQKGIPFVTGIAKGELDMPAGIIKAIGSAESNTSLNSISLHMDQATTFPTYSTTYFSCVVRQAAFDISKERPVVFIPYAVLHRDCLTIYVEPNYAKAVLRINQDIFE